MKDKTSIKRKLNHSTMNQESKAPTTPNPADLSTTKVPISPAKKFIVFIFLVLVLVAVGIGAYYAFRPAKKTFSNLTSTSALATVSITKNGFDPATIAIKAGQGVLWTNNDTAAHEVAADPYPLNNGIPGFNSTTVLLNGDSKSFVFDTKGVYHYHDQLNPTKFEGTIDVE